MRILLGGALVLLLLTSGATVAPRQQPLTDANILALMAQGDSIEVALAAAVRGRTENAAVRRYADELLRDHARGQRDVDALARRLNIRPQAPAGDTAAEHARHVDERLRGLKGFDFDTAVARHWIRDHQQDIQETEHMIGQAHDAAVKREAQKEMPTLRKHLSGAQALVRTLDREHARGAAREERHEKQEKAKKK